MTDIIKVYYLTDNDNVKNITVYMGSSRYQENMSELFKFIQSLCSPVKPKLISKSTALYC